MKTSVPNRTNAVAAQVPEERKHGMNKKYVNGIIEMSGNKTQEFGGRSSLKSVSFVDATLAQTNHCTNRPLFYVPC